MSKADLPVTLGQGTAVIDTTLRLPLQPKIMIEDVEYSVKGVLSDVVSTTLVPGRKLIIGTSRQNYSSEQMGPLSQVITGGHDHAAASVYAFRELMTKSADAKSFQDAVYEQFEIWQTRGHDDKGKGGQNDPAGVCALHRSRTLPEVCWRHRATFVSDSGFRRIEVGVVGWTGRSGHFKLLFL